MLAEETASGAEPSMPRCGFPIRTPHPDEGCACMAMDAPGAGRSEQAWDPAPRTGGEAVHDMTGHVAVQPSRTQATAGHGRPRPAAAT